MRANELRTNGSWFRLHSLGDLLRSEVVVIAENHDALVWVLQSQDGVDYLTVATIQVIAMSASGRKRLLTTA